MSVASAFVDEEEKEENVFSAEIGRERPPLLSKYDTRLTL